MAATPVPEEEESSINDRRLWIGNLDLRITEFVLLKLVQRFGQPERYDFMYHMTGPDKGRPKGYCFVTYPTKEMAEKAVRGLNGKMALSRRLIVHWAKEKLTGDVLAPSSSSLPSRTEEVQEGQSAESTESKIRAIEAKLSSMEESSKDFGLSELPSAPPGSNRYSVVNVPQKPANTHSHRGHQNRRRPYVHRPHRGRRR